MRGVKSRHHLTLLMFVLLLWLLLPACTRFGPKGVPGDRFNYNEAIADSTEEQLLLNLIRLRYAETPVFLKVSSVIAQYDRSAAVNASAVANGAITIWLKWRGSPQTVEWFPDPSEALEVGKVTVQTRGGLTRIDADIRQRKGAANSVDSMSSLVVATDNAGVRRGWDMSADLKNSEE